MQQTVLVGDEVTISSIDWAAGRGTVTAVAPRSSELVDPAIANVDHVVLLFGLTKPPVSLWTGAYESGRQNGSLRGGIWAMLICNWIGLVAGLHACYISN